MKGLFLCQRRFAVIAHAIALSLKERHGLTDFCGYVSTRTSLAYLKQQTDVNFNTLLLEEDIHDEYKNEKLDLNYLRSLEKEYGLPNLWPYIDVDRVIRNNQLVREYPYDTPSYTHEEMLRILQVMAKKIIKLFDEEQPDYVFMIAVGNMGSMLLYHIAKKRNVQMLMGIIGRVGDLFLLSEEYRNNSWADAIFDRLQTQPTMNDYHVRAKKIIEDFQNRPAPFHPDSAVTRQAVSKNKQLSFLRPRQAYQSVKWFVTMTKNYLTVKHHDFDEINPWYYLWDRIKRKTRCLIGFEDLYDQQIAGEDYAFFPLHLDPELATMLYAPFFKDQIYVIKQVARSLPVHFKLYVKEHPAMAGYRTRSFYKELKKIPNVKLIRPDLPSFGLTAGARIVTTITSTVGWEAILLKRPVITFGDVFYNKLSAVKQCKTIEQLPYLIKDRLENFSYQEAELINYLAAMLEDGIDVPLVTMWEKEIDQIDKIKVLSRPIADLIAKKLNLSKI